MKQPEAEACLILVMGVSGCGKSTVARKLATDISACFIEADDFHSVENRKRMAAGHGLNDEMRGPWVASLIREAKRHLAIGGSVVLAFSGLKQHHRERFYAIGVPTLGLMLDGRKQVIAERMRKRTGHFADETLLDSQFEDMQRPGIDEPVMFLPIEQSLERLHADALSRVISWQGEKT